MRTIINDLFRRPRRGFPALDGIRALAVLLVIFFHASAWVEFLGGSADRLSAGISMRGFLRQLWIGVDVFFVLSGFLIGRILLRQVRNGRVDYRGFYVRRVARIVPAYYLVLTVAAIVLSRLPTFAPLYATLSSRDLVAGGLKDALFLNNYLRSGPDVMGWAWSLCVEEHFYLVLPVFLSMLFRISPRSRLAVVALLPLLPMVVRASAYLENPSIRLWDGLNFQSHTRSDGLLLGVMIAYVHVFHDAHVMPLIRRFRVPMLLTAMVCFTVFFWRGGVFRMGIFPVVGQFFVVSVGVAMVVAVSLAVEDPVTRCLAHPFWYPVARVSYGMYLVHPFVALWLLGFGWVSPQRLLTSAPLLVGFGATAAVWSFFVACILFITVELPMLRWGSRIAGTTRPTENMRPASLI